MNTGRRVARRPSEVAVSIDVTPVMNMFVILIPFLVSMAAFSHLAVQQLALPGNEARGNAQLEADAPLVVSVANERILAMRGNRTLAKVDRLVTAASLVERTEKAGQMDQPEGSATGAPIEAGESLGALLGPILREARDLFPDLERVTLAVSDEVVCSDVVACFDACREAGFLDVGIAEAVQ